MDTEHQIPIWFFIGALLAVYGMLIFGGGVYAWVSHAQVKVALAHLHADVWWGLLLMLIGTGYTVKFWPFGKQA